MPVVNPTALITNRVEAIRAFHEEAKCPRAELDLSGGIDSAVMAGLLVLALGPENVTLAHLAIHTNPVQTVRASRLAAGLGCPLAVGNFSATCDHIVKEIVESLLDSAAEGPWFGGPGLQTPRERLRDQIQERMAKDPTILGSIRSTLRAPLGRAYNRIMGGGIRHGTGNECEDRFLRFYQKGGDGEVDTNPIAMLSKAEVYQLAFALAEHFDAKEKAATLAKYPNVPGMKGIAAVLDTDVKMAFHDTIRATPSADLWGIGDAHNDESEIAKWLEVPFTYGKLDPHTGKVTCIGTIERVARFLDEFVQPAEVSGIRLGGKVHEEVLFKPHLSQDEMRALVNAADKSPAFKDSGLTKDGILSLLRGARKAEKQTRHKYNPNCPSLGTRAELRADDILSDDFAEYGIKATEVFIPA